ncbi:hypothetical protein HMPREF9318_00227 [Streptococcus urinalis FB127-CNA-2]|uniref:carbamoyl-phosphate synthase (glutamine-hydrolyzing) n=1 Tax=Streptococcus urinalis 2285-97 TaxID=764291 RepID=G5KFC7_9STRE|nr:MGS-like domain protein [Streptococcus urinalis 2285-97]EKS22029.1 hypothetical protein HMPREF9318_00227 [Streptococcus urinalis FB127-CNA-2]VEF31841.1 carbamoyl phosphate synthase large subunit [Streptococcus urinalis]
MKAPVFSYEKLHKVDSLLGPEMKSTGEVMGSDKSIEKALYKAFEASYLHLPEFGTIVFTVANEDKKEAVILAKRFYDLGYQLSATIGTAKFFESKGILTTVVEKIESHQNTIPELIRQQQVQAIINTVGANRQSDKDGRIIRRTAIENGIPLFTSLDTVNAMLSVLESQNFQIKSI